MSASLIIATRRLSSCCRNHEFSAPVSQVYYPLEYAWKPHRQYLQQYGGSGGKQVLFVGMNPGPWGMAQTGIPFGDVPSVRDYLAICADVEQPPDMHPKRPVQGFSCARREVSGSRLWRFFAERYGSAERFFSRHFVINYCPLLFMRDSGANLTPDKLPTAETALLYICCDAFLQTTVAIMQPSILIGIGEFAEKRLQYLFGDNEALTIGKILHPSPASPASNRGFERIAAGQLDALGV